MRPARVFYRTLRIGTLTGVGIGAAVGTLIAPIVGTAIGAIWGLLLGPVFGLTNGVALAALTRCRPGRGTAALAAAAMSASTGGALWLWLVPSEPGGALGFAAPMFAIVGALAAPPAVSEPPPQPGSRPRTVCRLLIGCVR